MFYGLDSRVRNYEVFSRYSAQRFFIGSPRAARAKTLRRARLVKIPDLQPDPLGGWSGKKETYGFCSRQNSGPVPAEGSLKLSTDLPTALSATRAVMCHARVHRVRHMFQSQWIQVGEEPKERF
jgi:hypothetical protein